MRDLVAATSTDVDEGPMVRATRARFARLLPMIALRAKSTCPLEAARLGLEELEWRRSIRASSLPPSLHVCAPPRPSGNKDLLLGESPPKSKWPALARSASRAAVPRSGPAQRSRAVVHKAKQHCFLCKAEQRRCLRLFNNLCSFAAIPNSLLPLFNLAPFFLKAAARQDHTPSIIHLGHFRS